MTYNQHPDDQAPEWRRITSDEEANSAMPEFSFQDPAPVGQMFCDALKDPAHYQVALRRLVTPESLPAWGDFSEAAAFVQSLPDDVGTGTVAQRAHGDDNVAYFKIMSGVTESYQALEEQIVFLAGVVTLVWRPELGEWRVHAIGGDYTKPEYVPH
jgi:hypothetical protein